MENPSTWKTAELVIMDALDEFNEKVRKGGVIGPSEPSHIAWRLREAGLLNDHDESMIGWEGLRKHGEEREAAQ